MEEIFIIEDYDTNERLFPNQEFNTYEEGWDFIYNQYPVIYLGDGSQDSREEILDGHAVVKLNNNNKKGEQNNGNNKV